MYDKYFDCGKGFSGIVQFDANAKGYAAFVIPTSHLANTNGNAIQIHRAAGSSWSRERAADMAKALVDTPWFNLDTWKK